jgi:hypothetical protein
MRNEIVEEGFQQKEKFNLRMNLSSLSEDEKRRLLFECFDIWRRKKSKLLRYYIK